MYRFFSASCTKSCEFGRVLQNFLQTFPYVARWEDKNKSRSFENLIACFSRKLFSRFLENESYNYFRTWDEKKQKNFGKSLHVQFVMIFFIDWTLDEFCEHTLLLKNSVRLSPAQRLAFPGRRGTFTAPARVSVTRLPCHTCALCPQQE